jgi:hypothetical protein
MCSIVGCVCWVEPSLKLPQVAADSGTRILIAGPHAYVHMFMCTCTCMHTCAVLLRMPICLVSRMCCLCTRQPISRHDIFAVPFWMPDANPQKTNKCMSWSVWCGFCFLLFPLHIVQFAVVSQLMWFSCVAKWCCQGRHLLPIPNWGKIRPALGRRLIFSVICCSQHVGPVQCNANGQIVPHTTP